MTKKQTDRQTWSRPHTNRHNTDNTDTNRHCKWHDYRIFSWKNDHPKKESWWKGKVKDQKKKLKNNLNKDLCRICKVEYRSKEDYDRDSLWVRCARPGCSYCAHYKCSNIFYSSDDRDMLEAWSQLHFFCQDHMPLQDEDSPHVSPIQVCRSRRILSKYAGVGSN